MSKGILMYVLQQELKGFILGLLIGGGAVLALYYLSSIGTLPFHLSLPSLAK